MEWCADVWHDSYDGAPMMGMRGQMIIIINIGCCAVVRVTKALNGVVLPLATGIPPSSVTAMWVFGWCAVVQPGLSSPLHFC